MLHGSGRTASLWMEEGIPAARPLTGEVRAEVVVVGAGAAGLSVAYQLASEGRSVVVLDDGTPLSGETSRTSAHLASAMDDGFKRLTELFGRDGCAKAYASHAAAIDRIESIVRERGIDCEFERVPGYKFAAGDERVPELRREFEAAAEAGAAARWVERTSLGREAGPAIEFERQAMFHPVKYFKALLEACESKGASVYSNSHVAEVNGGADAHVVTRGGHRIGAEHVVIATNTPINDRVRMHTKLAAYRTYVIAGPVPKGSVGRALYWDNADPYHYVRLQPGEHADLLIVGGEDHKTGQGEEERRHAALERWARERFPELGSLEYRWSGQCMEPVDALGFIGRNPMDAENVYIVTGDSGQGLTHATIASMLIPDLITGRSSPWEELYAPNRKSLQAAVEYARENVNAVSQYADWVKPHSGAAADGEGVVRRCGLKLVAEGRDETGRHACSAICTHLGGVVRWNPVEGTWDCPVHGSRFSVDGETLHGPANPALSPANRDDTHDSSQPNSTA